MKTDTPSGVEQELGTLVETAMEKYHVPGVAVGITHGGEELTAGFGVTSIENPLPVTEHTQFQIGSTTKTITGTIAMRLVEKGRLDLDAPVRTYLPDLHLSDKDVAARITMRHLLTHTSGILGDYFDDPSRGDDALERMVEIVATLPQLTPLGEFWSYCNAGFYLAGRVIEVITGQTYERVVQETILDPIGMDESFFFPEDVMTHSFAVGHNVNEGETTVARPWALPRVAHPAGGITNSVVDNLKYARFQMGNGTTEDGTQILSAESMRTMQTPALPTSNGNWMGITWMIQDVGDTRIVGHGGGTNGQVSSFAMVPRQKFAVAVLTNAGEGMILQEVRDWALRRYLDLVVPEPLPVQITVEKLSEYAGRYEAAAGTLLLEPEDGRLRVEIIPKGGFPLPDSPPFPAVLIEGEGLLAVGDDVKGPLGEFIRDPEGNITWVRFGGRMHQRA